MSSRSSLRERFARYNSCASVDKAETLTNSNECAPVSDSTAVNDCAFTDSSVAKDLANVGDLQGEKGDAVRTLSPSEDNSTREKRAERSSGTHEQGTQTSEVTVECDKVCMCGSRSENRISPRENVIHGCPKHPDCKEVDDPRMIAPVIPKTQVWKRLSGRCRKNNDAEQHIVSSKRQCKRPAFDNKVERRDADETKKQVASEVSRLPVGAVVDTVDFMKIEDSMLECSSSNTNYEAISELIHHRISETSIQRSMLAVAYAHRTSKLLLLLDEPSRTIQALYRLGDSQAERLWGSGAPEHLSSGECRRLWKYDHTRKDIIFERCYDRADVVAVE